MHLPQLQQCSRDQTLHVQVPQVNAFAAFTDTKSRGHTFHSISYQCSRGKTVQKRHHKKSAYQAAREEIDLELRRQKNIAGLFLAGDIPAKRACVTAFRSTTHQTVVRNGRIGLHWGWRSVSFMLAELP